MQVQSNRVNNQTSFGTANVLTKTFKYLPKDKQIRSIAYITMGKIEPSLKEISKGVKLELGVKDYNKDNLFVSLTKRAILGKKHRFFMMIPAEKIGRTIDVFALKDFLKCSIGAFKAAINEDKNINPTDLYHSVITEVQAKMSKESIL